MRVSDSIRVSTRIRNSKHRRRSTRYGRRRTSNNSRRRRRHRDHARNSVTVIIRVKLIMK